MITPVYTTLNITQSPAFVSLQHLSSALQIVCLKRCKYSFKNLQQQHLRFDTSAFIERTLSSQHFDRKQKVH